MELPSINKRIKQLADYKTNGSIKKFAENIGVSQQKLNRLFNIDTRTKKYPIVTTDILVAISELYVDIDTRWMLTGFSKMTNTPDDTSTISDIYKSFKIENDDPDSELLKAYKEQIIMLKDEKQHYQEEIKWLRKQIEINCTHEVKAKLNSA